MDAVFAQSLLTGAGLYLLAGLVFGLVFVTFLVKRFDANAGEAAPIQFRLLILPGVIALWPLLALLMLKRTVMGGGS